MNTKSIFLLCMWLFAACFLHAQDKMPQAISYQAVARDAQGKVVAQKPIGIQVEILKGSTTGTVVFSETHSLTSSKTGTVNFLIGQGTCKTGTFSSVDWGADTYFLQLSMDLNGGSNYEKVSTTQMLPVPYALYAAKAGEVENGGNTGGVVGSVVDFIIVPGEGYSGYHDILAGKETSETNLDVYVIYLDGEDQEVEVIVEGTPEECHNIQMYPSSNNGKHLDISFSNEELSAGSYDVIITFKNKRGFTRKYPFIYIKENN